MSPDLPTPSSGAPENGSAGLVGALALVAALGAILLWVTILVGPWRLVTGLVDARDHIDRAESRLSKSDLKKGRYEALSAAAAVTRARSGLDVGAPFLDIARMAGVIDSSLGEIGHVLNAADHSARAAAGTVELTGRVLKGKHRVIAPDEENPKDSTIRLGEVATLGTSIKHVHKEITATREELQAIDQKNLPKRLRSDVTDGIKKAHKTEGLLEDAEAGFKVLPAFLGAEGPRTYLFGMQNNAEQRGTGGALLQFSKLTIEDGKPQLGTGEDATSRVYDIDRNRESLTIPLPEDAWYVRGISDAQRFGNANWSPDWPLSAHLTTRYGSASAEHFGVDFPHIDGIIAVDPIVMKELLPGTGNFRIKGVGTKITQRRVVNFLFYKAYAAFPNPRKRHPVLGKLVDSFFEKVVQPKSPSKLFSGMGTALGEKHMQMWMRDPDEEAFIERMDWDGAIEDATDEDYLMLIEQNVGGNKLDYYSTNTTTDDITVDGSDASHRVEAKIENRVFLPQPRFAMGDTGSPEAFRAGLGNVHRPMLNLYVPPNASLGSAAAEGERLDTAPEGDLARWPSATQPAEHSERGKRVWSGTLQIHPQEEGALTFDYRVPGVVHEAGGRNVYRLQVQHQPKVRPELLSLHLTLPDGARKVKAKGWRRQNGTLVWEHPLTEDMVLEVSWQE
jgi:hypothetical protein